MKNRKPRNPYERFAKFAINVLKQVESKTPLNEITVKNRSSKEIMELISLCAESGYINCIDYFKTEDGTPHIEFPNGLTIEGYKFLNSLYASSALKNSRFAKFSSIAAILVSLFSVISNIVLVYLSIK